MPVIWALGLDQAVWVAIALAFGFQRLRRPRRAISWIVSAFLLVFLISGLLGASGVRWVTFARDLVLALAFFTVVLSTPTVFRRPADMKAVLLGLFAFMTVSAATSLVAFVLQQEFAFTTALSPLIPDWIAKTGLGDRSLVHRSIAESSYFLGSLFERPKGFFLFSTSQSVAQTAAIPLMLAAGRWYPRVRLLLFSAAGLSFLALLASTTRGPLLALVGSAIAVWLLRRFEEGAIVVTIPLRGRGAAAATALVTVVVAGGFALGVFAPVFDVATTRSFGGRQQLYEATVQTWLQKPILGWGTERDWVPTPSPVPTATPTPTPIATATPSPSPQVSGPPLPQDIPPLGSHSQYLGVLFKQGVLGILLFIAILAILFRSSLALLRRQIPGRDWVIVGALATAVAAFTEELWLDPATGFVTALLFGAILLLGGRSPSPLDKDERLGFNSGP